MAVDVMVDSFKFLFTNRITSTVMTINFIFIIARAITLAVTHFQYSLDFI
jgi:hypothetical protein